MAVAAEYLRVVTITRDGQWHENTAPATSDSLITIHPPAMGDRVIITRESSDSVPMIERRARARRLNDRIDRRLDVQRFGSLSRVTPK
ncbi:MAG: hypothetical protein ACYCUI_11515 [Vulcanimicrobiaceae bacterium]